MDESDVAGLSFEDALKQLEEIVRDGIEDVLAVGPTLPRLGTHRAEALAGDHEVVAPPGEPLPHDLLGAPDRRQIAPHGVHVSGVEERDAGLGRGVEDGEARRLVALIPEGHRAEAQAGDLEAGPAEAHVFHGHEPTVRAHAGAGLIGSPPWTLARDST